MNEKLLNKEFATIKVLFLNYRYLQKEFIMTLNRKK